LVIPRVAVRLRVTQSAIQTEILAFHRAILLILEFAIRQCARLVLEPGGFFVGVYRFAVFDKFAIILSHGAPLRLSIGSSPELRLSGRELYNLSMQLNAAIREIRVSDTDFDAALDRFAVIDEQLISRADVGRDLERDEVLTRYAFTGFVEALRSEEFDEDPLETVEDLELPGVYESDDEAWNAIKAFYAERACVLLRVAEAEEFIVGDEIVDKLGFL
jgi:hypothetical protein